MPDYGDGNNINYPLYYDTCKVFKDICTFGLTYGKMIYFQFDLFLSQIENKLNCVMKIRFGSYVKKVILLYLGIIVEELYYFLFYLKGKISSKV